jgi:hypothetical protein
VLPIVALPTNPLVLSEVSPAKAWQSVRQETAIVWRLLQKCSEIRRTADQSARAEVSKHERRAARGYQSPRRLGFVLLYIRTNGWSALSSTFELQFRESCLRPT